MIIGLQSRVKLKRALQHLSYNQLRVAYVAAFCVLALWSWKQCEELRERLGLAVLGPRDSAISFWCSSVPVQTQPDQLIFISKVCNTAKSQQIIVFSVLT